MARGRQRERYRRRQPVRETHDEPNTSWRDNPYSQRTVAEGWDAYVREFLDRPDMTALFSETAVEVVRSESRRAFYGGAWHLLRAMQDGAAGRDLNAGAALVEARRAELEAFAQAGLLVEARVRELGDDQPETVLAGWLSFERNILDPADAPPVQRTACRRAFYAGAHQMFRCFVDTSGPGVPEDEGAAYLEERQNEVVRFYADVQAGRA